MGRISQGKGKWIDYVCIICTICMTTGHYRITVRIEAYQGVD